LTTESNFKMKIQMTNFLVVIVATLISRSSQNLCSKKEARKSQRLRLKSLNKDVDAIVIAKFLHNNEEIYKFSLVETWPTYNAGLDKKEEGVQFKVKVPESLHNCVKKIRLEEKFYLILKKDSSNQEVEFKLLEPMVPSRMPRIRKHVNAAICNSEKICPKVAVKVPKNKIVDESRLDITTCRIQTVLKKDEYTVKWFYNNDDLKDDSEEVFIRDSNEGLNLIIDAKYKHTGDYTCKVTVKDTNEVYESSLEIFVKSKFEVKCDSEHCNGHGKCFQNMYDANQQKTCRCDAGFDGPQCRQRQKDRYNPNVLEVATPFPASGSAIVGSLIALSILLVAAAFFILKRVRSTENKVMLLLESRKKYMSDKTRKMIFQGATLSSSNMNSSQTPILATSLNNSIDNFNLNTATRSFTPSSIRSAR